MDSLMIMAGKPVDIDKHRQAIREVAGKLFDELNNRVDQVELILEKTFHSK
jgi:hypothetical protein